MADLLLNVRPHPKYEDGDVVSAFSDRFIQAGHAQVLCRDTGTFTQDGLRPSGSLYEREQALAYQYRFTRIGPTLAIREELLHGVAVGEPVPVGAVQDPSLRMDVPLYLALRLKHPRHRIFGTPGAEVWYGGRYDLPVTAIWQDIEARTAKRLVDHLTMPFSDHVRKSLLPVRVDALTDAEASEAVAPVLEPDPETGELRVVKARARAVDWAALLEGTLNLTDVRDGTKVSDARGQVLAKAAIAQKGLAGGVGG